MDKPPNFATFPLTNTHPITREANSARLEALVKGITRSGVKLLFLLRSNPKSNNSISGSFTPLLVMPLTRASSLAELASLVLGWVFVKGNVAKAACGNGNKGWPLKQFVQMEEICNKIKSLVKRVPKDYVLIDMDADWIRNYGQKGLYTDGKRVTIDGKKLAFAITSYWKFEFLSVGASLLYMFDLSKFLLDCEYLNVTSTNRRKLKRFLEISLSYFDLVFPLDWQNLVSEDLVPIRNVYLENREDTISWIQRLKIDSSYYPLLVLKLVTLLSIICLKVDHAEFILDLLSGRNNIYCFLPKKFMGDLLRKREDKKLNLDIEVVAEASLSINDPLVIVTSANATPKITAIKVLDKISEAMNGKNGVALSKLSGATIIKEEVVKNIGTLATILVDQKLWSDKDEKVIRTAYDIFEVLSETFDKRPKIDKLLNHYVTSQTLNVEEPGDEELVLLENQSQCDNTQDGNKKGKGNSKGKKSNKSKGKKKYH
nr:UvrD-like helicase, ATP-binding domain, P-loop containing nucleoside triphosphate hydrolase [Tanacetum cinerariifolium]